MPRDIFTWDPMGSSEKQNSQSYTEKKDKISCA